MVSVLSVQKLFICIHRKENSFSFETFKTLILALLLILHELLFSSLGFVYPCWLCTSYGIEGDKTPFLCAYFGNALPLVQSYLLSSSLGIKK